MTEQSFRQLAAGYKAALNSLYTAYYGHVTGVLVYKYRCPQDEAQEIYTDTVLRFQDKVIEGSVENSNVKAYLQRIAINFFLERKRKAKTALERSEAYLHDLAQTPPDEYDPLVAREDRYGLETGQQTRLLALQKAMARLDEICRNLLTDSIALGIKPRFLAEKFGFKNARVVSDKKSRCKQELKSLVQQLLAQPESF